MIGVGLLGFLRDVGDGGGLWCLLGEMCGNMVLRLLEGGRISE